MYYLFWQALALVSCTYGHFLHSNESGFPHKAKVAKFSKDFIFGVGTSAYQIEGAWNVDGKGPSWWDNFTHRVPSPIYNNDTGDIACDSYYRYKEDVKLAADLGIKDYRFSISWSRVLPTGYVNSSNELGIAYYRNVLNEILKYNMTPVVTLYHWDLPQNLYEEGIHWTNPALIPIFVDYARFVISKYPEVGLWTTINEPKQICHGGYGVAVLAPGINGDGFDEYQCAYIVLKAHAAVYHMYKKEFAHYKAQMSIVVDCQWAEPYSDSPADKEAAERKRQFECGLYYHPVFIGDWPKIVKDRIDERSKLAHLPKSRLPSFTQEEIETIKGTHDYLGLNHYTTVLVSNVNQTETIFSCYEQDMGVVDSKSPRWRLASNSWGVVPWGARKVLNWLKREYNNPKIFITELGMSDNGTYPDDDERIDYFIGYVCNIYEAMVFDKVNVVGITAWSLLDNFEWPMGYSSHFGFYNIDFYNDPTLTRRPKKSAEVLKQFIKKRTIKCNKPPKYWLPVHKE